MGDLTRDFSRYEFACPCGCGLDSADIETVTHLQYERDFWSRGGTRDHPIHVLSGFRCLTYTKSRGWSLGSQHPLGRAVDSTIAGIPPPERYAYYQERWPNRYGIGVYIRENFLHFDSRTSGPARWVGEGDDFKL